MRTFISVPAQQFKVLGLSGTPISHTGNTDETILATVRVPGGSMGPHGMLRVTHFWSFTNSANNKSPRVRLGGIAGVAFGAPVHTANVQSHQQHSIANAGATNSQEYFIASNTTGFSASSGALAAASSIDTTVDQDLVITAQLALGSETLTLRRYLVELIVP